MNKFWELVRESVIFSGSITLILLCTACYMWIVGMEVPDPLMAALTIAMGYFFGSKAMRTAQVK